jgi:hypothetical protein
MTAAGEPTVTAPGTPTVAVLGATGAVGRSLVTLLTSTGPASTGPASTGPASTGPASTGLAELRLGGRDVVSDPAALDMFVKGATVLVNCLGPAYRTRGRIAAAAQRAGVPYVDPGGDDTTYERIRAAVLPQGVEIPLLTGVGSVPGVFGLMPRWLAAGLPEPVRSMTGYVLTIEPIHAGTAMEFLLGMLDPRAASAWSAGGRTATPPEPLTGVRLPYVDGPLDAHPFLSGELEAVATDLQLREATFYQTFESGSVALRALHDIGARRTGGAGIRELAAELATVVNDDMRHKPALHLLGFEARSDSLVRSAVLRTTSSYRLTAMLALLAAREIIAGRVPPGVFRADVLAPGLVAALPDLDPDTHLESRDTTLDSWQSDS